jgi:3,4-dihydroxy 2-butanone 4-phosphate synthase/GTP cyclohydrolase II
MNPRVARAVEAIAAGGAVIVTDDADRENEGDLVMAADAVTPEAIAFMAVQGRGLICLALEPARCAALDLAPMVGGAGHETNFTVSVDLDVAGSTGISAADRARTIRRAVDPTAAAADFRRPGHVFPLRYTPGGVLARRGHTEASVDLARLAGRTPAGVICEIMNDDGTMARGADLAVFAERHKLPIVSIAELAHHLRERRRRPGSPLRSGTVVGRDERRASAQTPAIAPGFGVSPEMPYPAAPPMATGGIERVVDTVLPTRFGRWRTVGFRSDDGLEYVALLLGEPDGDERPLVRIHSECLTGDALGSERCDCGRQLALAMEQISAARCGVVVYVRGHEGRGIGLLPKLQAYALQDGGLDTVDANLHLGYDVDARSYRGAAAVLLSLGIRRVRLLTNNPDKVAALRDAGITVAGRLPLVVPTSPDNLRYLTAKRARLGHELSVTAPADTTSCASTA